jgi:hypothetical protein
MEDPEIQINKNENLSAPIVRQTLVLEAGRGRVRAH